MRRSLRRAISAYYVVEPPEDGREIADLLHPEWANIRLPLGGIWTLGGRVVPTAGFAGCLALAFALPLNSALLGTAVLLVGTAAYAVRQRSA